MAGLIRGFLGGAAKAGNQIGLMQLQDQIKREGDEASALRDSTLKTSERLAGQEFKSEESRLDRESREKIAGSKPAAKPQLIKYTDSKGDEQQGILNKNEDGSFNIIRPGSDEVVESKITTEQLKNKAAQMNVAEGKGKDWIPWNEYGPKDEPVRAAVVNEKKGLVASQMKKPAAGQKYDEGTELTGPGGKIYVVKNGVPVLKNP